MERHRHITGEKITEFFVTQENSDLTEGRGGMVDVSVFTNHMDAYKKAKGRAVQGCGDGDVVKRTYYRCTECPELIQINEKIYIGDSYTQKNTLGKPGRYQDYMIDGWHKDYSPKATDPEYPEYLRLKKKFES